MKILIIRDKASSFQAGIQKHCFDLYQLFKDEDNIFYKYTKEKRYLQK